MKTVKQPQLPIQTAMIQVIHTTWNKSARGGELAVKRNSVPRHFCAHSALLRPQHFFISEEFWGENNNFDEASQYTTKYLPFDKAFKIKRATIEYSDNQLQVIYGGSGYTGEPHPHFPKKCFLHLNQWTTIEWNARLVDYDNGTWWYEQTTIHIAFVGDQELQNVLRREPINPISDLKILW